MPKPKPVKATKTVALSADTNDRAMIKRLLAAMETFMSVDAVNDQVALARRAA